MDEERRTFLKQLGQGTVTLALLPFAARLGFAQVAASSTTLTPLHLSNAEWKKRLTPEQYHVLREAGTEAPFTSPLNNEHRGGVFVCAACALPLFDSHAKFDSGTGWPSFYQPLTPQAVTTHTDFKLVVPRTEVRCARCDGHLGHVFKDGPQPTGLRYCMNGVALAFKPVV